MSSSEEQANGDDYDQGNEQNGSGDGIDELFGESGDSAVEDEDEG